MRTTILTAGFVLGMGSMAAACPTWELGGLTTIEAHGADFFDLASADAIAGGANDMAACNLSGIGTGYVATQPDFEFRLAGMENYSRIEFRLLADCDAVLLMNDANKAIRYNDDTNGTDPVIGIDSPSNGTYHLWIGTIGPDGCEAELFVETF